MALSGPQFDFFELRLDEFQGRLLSIETDLAALEVLATASDAKLDTLVSVFGDVNTNVNATVTTIGGTNDVLDKIRQKLVGLRSG